VIEPSRHDESLTSSDLLMRPSSFDKSTQNFTSRINLARKRWQRQRFDYLRRKPEVHNLTLFSLGRALTNEARPSSKDSRKANAALGFFVAQSPVTA